MGQFIVQAYDNVAKAAHGPLIKVRTIGEAERVWDHMRNGGDKLIQAYPEQFVFVLIGTQDDDTQEIAPLEHAIVAKGKESETPAPTQISRDQWNQSQLGETDEMRPNEDIRQVMIDEIEKNEAFNG